MAYRRGGYWYRSKREGNRVLTQYLGPGVLAEAARERDALRKSRRKQERAALRAEQEREREIDRSVDAAEKLVTLLTEAALLASGYHSHKRQWRKQR